MKNIIYPLLLAHTMKALHVLKKKKWIEIVFKLFKIYIYIYKILKNYF
jgi:hypothetical protein